MRPSANRFLCRGAEVGWMALTTSIAAFLLAWLIGSAAIYLGAGAVTEVWSGSRAALTALLGAVAWALTGWVPLLGPVLALFVWVAVIRWRYPGGWSTAAIVGLVAWGSAIVIIYLANGLFDLGIRAFGVPGA